MQRKIKTLADYIDAVRRRSTVVLVSFVVVFVGGVYLAYDLPGTYRSSATILIEQPNVPADFVQGTVTTYAEEQIELVRRKVMSTESLAAIVEQYGLYPEAVASDPTLRAAVQALRDSTFLEPQAAEIMNARGRSEYATIAFTLAFDHTDSETAFEIATELSNLYLKENVESQTNQTQRTVDFLRLDIESARTEAETTGAELARFKERHAGNLPEMLSFFLQSIERTEQQIDNLDREIRDSRSRIFSIEMELATTNPFGNAVDEDGNPIVGTADRLAQLQNERLRLLSIYAPAHPDVVRIEREIEMIRGEASGAAPGASAVATREQLNATRAELQEARRLYTDDHPDVVRLRRTVETLEQQLERNPSAAPPASSLASLASRDPLVQQLREQVQNEQAYLQVLLSRRSELESKLDELQSRVAAMPQIEQEYQLLTQKNELAISRYKEAVAQLDAAERAQTLEAEGGGRRLTILEPPYLPAAPYKPNRRAIVMLAFMVAIGVGIGAAALIDSYDDSVRGAADLAELTGGPPLAVVPFLQTAADRRRHWGSVIAKVAFLVGGMAAAVSIAVAASG